MAIEGLQRGQQPNVNVSDDVGASFEAMQRLGLVPDALGEQILEDITGDFRALRNSGKTGELYVYLRPDLVTIEEINEVSDGGTYLDGRKYPKSYVDREIWTPGDETEDPLGANSNWPSHGRLAVHNPNSHYGPLLHFLKQPFDDRHAEPGEETQLEALAGEKEAYEANHPGFNMISLDGRAVAIIGLTRRIKGVDDKGQPIAMPINTGYMNDPTRPRKTVGGLSCVADVLSGVGQLKFYGSVGGARPAVGVGVSVGQKPLEAQAS